MMRREFSSQHPASSKNTSSTSPSSSSSSSTTRTTRTTRTTSTSASTASPAASSPIHLRRQQRRRTAGRHALHSSSSPPPSSSSSSRPHAHAIKTSTLLARNPALAHKLRQMALPLSPLVQLTTGHVHPHFPTNVLQFWLLTDAQLESLAGFYHQAVPHGGRPSPWAAQYPCPVRWRSDASLEIKRRRMGRFIGLRGCDSPVEAVAPRLPSLLKSEEEIAQEARLARLAADDEALRRKTAPGPWGR